MTFLSRNGSWAFPSGIFNRRCCASVASRFASQQFIFTVAALSVICAKLVHIYAHLAALSLGVILQWGLSFFFQDTLLLLFLRYLLDQQAFSSRWVRIPATLVAVLICFFVLALGTVNISFYALAGTEVHWRNVGFVGDKTSRKVLVSGLFSSAITGTVILGVSWVLQDLCYSAAGMVLDVAKWPFIFVLRKIPFTRRFVQPAAPTTEYQFDYEYDHVNQQENQNLFLDEPKHERGSGLASRFSLRTNAKLTTYLYVFFGVVLFIQLASYMFQPNEASLVFMSWNLILLPWVDFSHSSPSLSGLLPFRGNGINREWDTKSALTKPIHWSWLPKEKLAGFEDWYEPNADHYNAAEDPLRISNLDDDLLPELRDTLANTSIRHVVLVKLESTRNDVFPIKKDGYIWNKLSRSFGSKHLSEAAEERLSTLTPVANLLTGDFDDGFKHNSTKGRGGLSFSNAFTTATYTMKSMTGTLCGITPLLADFNIEHLNHVYQPCLAQIFDAFNTMNDDKKGVDPNDFRTFNWRSSFVQSVTNGYDHQWEQMPGLGYVNESFVYAEYLRNKTDKEPRLGIVDIPDINYFGMPEVAIEDYVRDAFVSAKKNNERAFLFHMTSTTHHPFGMPAEEEYVSLAEDGGLDELSHYINTIGYADRWFGKILNILEEEGVANETLIIFTGDHGLSIAEDGGNTPYNNPNIGCFHIPLVLSHPQLPQIQIDSPVQNIQVLPTILDMLRVTKSLPEIADKAADDLARNYEGQSLIRPLKTSDPAKDLSHWEFTVLNPGRIRIAVRNANFPDFRLMVPVVENVEWRFTDIKKHPHEEEAILSFGFREFLQRVEKDHSKEASEWCEDAAFMARWWVEDNRKRYRYEIV